MRLDRPTHGRESNRSSGWMSDFTEEVPGQIAAGINRLGDGKYTYYSIYELPAARTTRILRHRRRTRVRSSYRRRRQTLGHSRACRRQRRST